MPGIRIGVVGYSTQEFDRDRAREVIADQFDEIVDSADVEGTPVVVSGLTDVGVPGLAYREAERRGWRTVGVACARADRYPWYPVDESVVRDEWEEWGDESEAFLGRIDVLIRVGGGSQARAECVAARERGLETREWEC